MRNTVGSVGVFKHLFFDDRAESEFGEPIRAIRAMRLWNIQHTVASVCIPEECLLSDRSGARAKQEIRLRGDLRS
jgi:hypothetical protein